MYIIEGNIGTGKSTFLRAISAHLPHLSIGLEPLNNWQGEEYGQSLLKNFYEDPKRWAYTLETLTLMVRIKEQLAEQTTQEPMRLVERSIYSGYYCFTKNGYEQGFLTDVEWHVYMQWFEFLTQKCALPKGFIYLRTSPEISFERIKKRNRFAETNISLDYIRQIHEKHEEFLITKQKIEPKLQNIPVLVIDCDKEFEHSPETIACHAQTITNFLHTTF
jgi:deoxyadenosine/deoxycytidine kinase